MNKDSIKVCLGSLLLALLTSSHAAIQSPVLNQYPAPELKDIYFWMNSVPLQLQALKGKVILIHFWTYSSIDCLRDLLFVNRWYSEYHDKGLIVIGVHAPEFGFEKNVDNVKHAILAQRILFPVALDNQLKTWHRYHNQYWPARYLIDKKGYVVYQHFGEGAYDITENNIRFLLGMSLAKKKEAQAHPVLEQTPEMYLGYSRAHWVDSGELIKDKVAEYHFPEHLADNQFAIDGNWLVTADKITASKTGAAINLHFNSKKVYMIMGNQTGKPIQVKVLLDGKLLADEQGKDVKNSVITVNQSTVYEVVALKKEDDKLLQVIASDPGLEVYMFTFGG